MKKGSKLLFVLLGTAAFGLASCGETETNKRILKIEFVKGGFGLTPYEKLAEAFMAEHKDVEVKLVPNPEMASTTSSKLVDGTNLSDVMIYNRSVNNIYAWAKKGYIYKLDGLLKEEVENGETLLDKMDSNAKKVAEYDSSYWCLPEYYNINGFVYNATLFERNGWNTPRTTKEFEELCEKIAKTELAGKNVKPIVYCGNGADGYLYYAIDGWMTSFEGTANMDKFYSFESSEVYNPVNSKGKNYGMSLLKKYFYDSGYAYEGSMSLGAIEGQSKLLTYEAAMMLNGSWFENEMKPYTTPNSPTFKMFAIPEISDASGNVLHDEGYLTNEENEQVLNTEVVANMFIPAKATNKEDAAEFLKFISKNSSLELYTKYSNAIRPMNYDYTPANPAYSDMSAFGKSVLEMASTHNLYVPISKAAVAVVGKATLYPQGGYWSKRIYSNPGKYTPSFCLESDYVYAKNNWNDWVNYAQEELGA